MRQAVSGKRLIDLPVSLSDPLDATPFFSLHFSRRLLTSAQKRINEFKNHCGFVFVFSFPANEVQIKLKTRQEKRKTGVEPRL